MTSPPGTGAQRPGTDPAPAAWWGVPIGLVVALIGSLGTWESSRVEILGASDATSSSGFGDGGAFVMLLTIAATVLLVLWRAERRSWYALAGAVGAGAAVAICVSAISDANEAQEAGLGIVNVGWGLWCALVGSIVLTLTSLVLALRRGGGTGT